jgi:deoxyribodipyrimidine photo-lyase
MDEGEPAAPGVRMADMMTATRFEPTRAAGLSRLAAFLPRAGRAYAGDRNTDRGPERHDNVSGLSPYIRRRLITEEEVIAAVLAAHDYAAAEKFIQEVFWRTYWKGWLELRPGVLSRYQSELAALKARLAADADLSARLDAALSSRTGIDCFDAWMGELETTGWLHNHARIWFASIWIFTLRLPWQLGADAFFTRLVDADPASNTLSWRWVAGLQTRGKHYLARAANIHQYTDGRFDPAGRLDEDALPLADDGAIGPAGTLAPAASVAARQVMLLLTEEDLHPESLPLEAEVAGVAVLAPPSPGRPGSPAALFAEGALADGLKRAAAHFGVSAGEGDISAFAKALGVSEIVTAEAPQGPVRAALDRLAVDLAAEGVRLVRLRRPFDARCWPHARAGFFPFREKIPAFLSEAGLLR